jgi:hypothetical protein
MKIISATKAKAAPTNTALKEFVSPIVASSFGVDGTIKGQILALEKRKLCRGAT